MEGISGKNTAPSFKNIILMMTEIRYLTFFHEVSFVNVHNSELVRPNDCFDSLIFFVDHSCFVRFLESYRLKPLGKKRGFKFFAAHRHFMTNFHV